MNSPKKTDIVIDVCREHSMALVNLAFKPAVARKCFMSFRTVSAECPQDILNCPTPA
jgi:hypothetical protein